MPAIERIDSLYDIASISKEHEVIAGNFRVILGTMNDVQKGINDVLSSKGGSGLATETTKLTKAQTELQKQAVITEKLMQEREKTEQQALKTTRLKTAESDRAAKADERSSKEIEKQKKLVEELASDYKILSQAKNDASKRAIQLQLTAPGSQAAKDAIAEAQALDTKLKQLDASTGVYSRNVGNYSSAFTGYANTLRGLRGPTKLLGEALGIGAQEADQFRLIIEHAFQGIAAFFKGKEAKAAATAADTVATTENTAATAANTASWKSGIVTTNTAAASTETLAIAETELAAATTASSIAMKVLRIALITTGIGILIGLIAYAVQQYHEYKDAAEKAAEKQKLFNDVVTEANKNSAKEIDTAKALKAAAEDVTNSTENRLKAVKKLRNEFPDYFKNLTDEQILNGKVSDTYKTLTKDIETNARALAAKSKIDELVSQQLDLEFQKQKIRNATNQELANAKDTRDVFVSGGTGGAAAAITVRTKAQNQAIIIARREFALSEVEVYNKRIQNQIEFLKTFVGGETAIGNAIAGEKENQNKKGKKVAKDYADDALKAQAEANKLLLQLQNEYLKSIIDDESVSLLSRLAAFDQYYKNQIELRNIDKADAKAAIIEKTQFELKQEGLTSNQKRDIKKAERINLANEERKAELDITKIRLEESARRDKLLKEIERKSSKTDALSGNKSLIQNEIESLQRIGSAKLIQIAIDSNKEQTLLNNRYANGKISKEKYERDLLKIQQKYALEALNTQKDTLTKLLPFLSGDEYKKAIEKISEIDLHISLLGVKVAEKTKEQIISTLEKIRSVFDDVFSFISAALNANIDSQKNSTDDLEKKQQENYDAEKQRIEDSTLSQEERDRRLKNLEAQRKTQAEQNERRQRQLDIERARFEKQATIFRLTLVLAEAIATLNVFKIIAASAQLGVAIATPLPHYATGTDNSPEGLAVVSERGSEGRVEPDGSFSLTPNKASLTWLRQGTKIIPHDKLVERLGTAAISGMPTYNKIVENNDMKGFSVLNDAINYQTNQLKQELRRAGKKVVVNNRIDTNWGDYVNRKVYGK